MPKVCEKCNKEFPFWIKVDEKRRCLKNRKYCLKCSPHGKHNTRSLHNRGKSDKKRESFEVNCSICDRKYSYTVGKTTGHSRTKCNSCLVNAQRTKKKEILVNYKGGKCAICGYKKCIKALEFHHEDPTTKEFTLGYQANFALDRLKKEADKCLLLCANCHRELHYKEVLEKKLKREKSI